MPATIVSLSVDNGLDRFYCPFCAAMVFDEESGLAEDFCGHVRVFVDWAGELIIPEGTASALSDQMYQTDCSDPTELAALFGDDSVVFELVEPGRGGGHDGGACLIVFGTDSVESER